jgi:hypothetical protein
MATFQKIPRQLCTFPPAYLPLGRFYKILKVTLLKRCLSSILYVSFKIENRGKERKRGAVQCRRINLQATMNAFYRDFTSFTSPEILTSVRNVENPA